MSNEEWDKLTSYEKLNYRICELDLSEETLNNLCFELTNVREEILDLEGRINKALDKLYCYGEIFDREILKQFQKEMENILKGEE